ncbi:MAG: tRNA pseudouridine synthase B [Chlamydiales bacterium]|nr:tRNA pseudouridine synthase B [Chlamydiales bacterium]MCH9620200.1 tRNA pseudouridine synthase B [Chlamydiales bacterium]MCH9623085.1 tRNA pseudouridine synthase B [Chlamydiales bacterium]
MNNLCTELVEGILLVDKPEGKTSFSLISALRKLTGIKKIGHAGTLDPFATGVMVLLIGKRCTKLSDKLLLTDKAYHATVQLGITTDTYDCDGKVVARSKKKPSLKAVKEVVEKFQGKIEQVPPMFSAKKIGGKKLYELAREGKTIERKPCAVEVEIEIANYHYPQLELSVSCSKGTYIRSLAHEIGEKLGAGAHLTSLKRTKSGDFHLDNCIDGQLLYQPGFDILPHLMTYEAICHSQGI